MLKFDNICKTFNPGTPDAAVVFQNFNLELEKGEFLAIVGSNGSGKTTLLNILCGSIPGKTSPARRSTGARPKWGACFRTLPGASARA